MCAFPCFWWRDGFGMCVCVCVNKGHLQKIGNKVILKNRKTEIEKQISWPGVFLATKQKVIFHSKPKSPSNRNLCIHKSPIYACL